jgi:hypothetical protein
MRYVMIYTPSPALLPPMKPLDVGKGLSTVELVLGRMGLNALVVVGVDGVDGSGVILGGVKVGSGATFWGAAVEVAEEVKEVEKRDEEEEEEEEEEGSVPLRGLGLQRFPSERFLGVSTVTAMGAMGARARRARRWMTAL